MLRKSNLSVVCGPCGYRSAFGDIPSNINRIYYPEEHEMLALVLQVPRQDKEEGHGRGSVEEISPTLALPAPLILHPLTCRDRHGRPGRSRKAAQITDMLVPLPFLSSSNSSRLPAFCRLSCILQYH